MCVPKFAFSNNASIPAFAYGINVTFIIMAQDNAGNNITTQELGYTYYYQVVPEFPTFPTVMSIFAISTLVVVALGKRKQHIPHPHV